MLQNNQVLKSLIRSLWNTLWSGGIANPLTAIEQITYLLFMKRLDDMEIKQEEEARTAGDKYEPKRFGGIYLPYVNEGAYPFSEIENPTERQNMQVELMKAKAPRSAEELRWHYFKEIMPIEKMLEHVRYNVFPLSKN